MAYIKIKSPLILASSSPRRQELLQRLDLDFEIISPEIDESCLEGETANQYVARLAQEKAQAVLEKRPDAIVIAADTTVCIDNEIIGKPANKQQAFDIWQKLSGRWHEVMTGVCVAGNSQSLTTVVTTKVEFQSLMLEEMEEYWETGEPIGKAGAYAIQGIASQYIPQLQGSYTNVVGLPLYETVQLLRKVAER